MLAKSVTLASFGGAKRKEPNEMMNLHSLRPRDADYVNSTLTRRAGTYVTRV